MKASSISECVNDTTSGVNPRRMDYIQKMMQMLRDNKETLPYYDFARPSFKKFSRLKYYPIMEYNSTAPAINSRSRTPYY